MNACAYRGTTSHAKYSGTYCGKNSIQTANHAAAVAPRTPRSSGIVVARSSTSSPIPNAIVRDDAPTTSSARIVRLARRKPVPDPHRRVRQSAIGKGVEPMSETSRTRSDAADGGSREDEGSPTQASLLTELSAESPFDGSGSLLSGDDRPPSSP